MTEDRKPRQRGETFAGTTILTIGIALAALATVLLTGDYPTKDVPQWFPGAFLAANATILILWGTAILHGGFEGRRYK